MVSKGTSPYTRRLGTGGRTRCLQSCLLGGRACNISTPVYRKRVLSRAAPLPAAPEARVRAAWVWPHQLRRRSQAIDFRGHQIMPGLAEHMPFSAGRSLSLSQINSSNYRAPHTQMQSGPSTLSSRNWNEETQYRPANHAEASTHGPLVMASVGF